ncbi:MAG: TraR/DksA C4-type zinc finger protein [Verrucomicrobia bacterium]|nr:TraR/DksA C4-type zinc finger protein [Verrucomicrobiota bacterium]
MAKHKKPAPHAKKPAPKKAVQKTVPKKVVSAPAKKPAPVKDTAPAKKPAPKPAPTTKQAVPPKPKSAVPSNTNKKANEKKESARDLLRSRILGSKKANKPIAFSLDEVREIAKTVAKTVAETEAAAVAKAPVKVAPKTIDVTKTAKPAQPNHIKAASLADILGFNPKKPATKPPIEVDIESVPEKYRRYYKLLLDLRAHLTEGIELHSEETLKRSSKDDSGDLSSYGQHMADAGTDTFDRDFALSLVSSEQEALTEIEAAIKRVKDGSYGTCEITGKPIAKERLSAVPFTRYSAEAQKDIERNRMRTRSSPGLFGELGEDGAKIEDSGGDDE